MAQKSTANYEKSGITKCLGYKKENCDQFVKFSNLCKNCLGAKFEDNVADLFRLMGYTVEQNKHISGRQIDLYINFTQGITTICGIVECKYHRDTNVGADEVSQVAAAAGPWLRSRKIDKAYLITTRGFASTAKANAEENGIECYTYDQLLSSLVDFTPHLKRMVDEFEADPLYNTYVDLNCSIAQMKQLNRKEVGEKSSENLNRFQPQVNQVNKKGDQDETVKDEENRKIRIEEIEKKIAERIRPTIIRRRARKRKESFDTPSWLHVNKTMKYYIRRWLDLPNSNHISILGDFGSGKTSFSRYFSYLTAKRHLMNPVRHPRIPLLIRLSTYARLEKGSVQAMVTDFLVNECNIQTSYATFQKFMSAGKLLLLLYF